MEFMHGIPLLSVQLHYTSTLYFFCGITEQGKENYDSESIFFFHLPLLFIYFSSPLSKFSSRRPERKGCKDMEREREGGREREAGFRAKRLRTRNPGISSRLGGLPRT